MESIYKGKGLWLYYLISLGLTIPFVIVFSIRMGFEVLTMFQVLMMIIIVPLILISEVIKNTILNLIDKKTIVCEIRQSKKVVIICFGMIYTTSLIVLMTDSSTIFSLIVYIFLLHMFYPRVIITQEKIYYRELIINKDEVVRVEKMSNNIVRLVLKSGKKISLKQKNINDYNGLFVI